jgi:hypothetical protein
MLHGIGDHAAVGVFLSLMYGWPFLYRLFNVARDNFLRLLISNVVMDRSDIRALVVSL